MQPFRFLRRAPVLPGAGARVIFIGDSISDHNYNPGVRQGKYADSLRQQYGWTLLNASVVSNPDFEQPVATKPLGLVTATGITASRDSAHAGAQGSSWAAKLLSDGTVGGTASLEGDAGAMCLGMRAGETYTFGMDVYAPTTVSGLVQTYILDRVGSGSYNLTGVTVTKANSWQRITATRTIVAGATEAFVRPIQLSAPAAGDAVWIDNLTFSCNTTDPSAPDTSNTYRSGISNTLLQTTDNDGQFNLNLLYQFPTVADARINGYAPLDLVSVSLGTNDYGYVWHTAAGATATKTRDTWRIAVNQLLGYLTQVAPNAVIVLIGLGYIQFSQTAGQPAYPNNPIPQWGTGSATVQKDTWADMNAITQQACRDYGAVYVDISAMTNAQTVDGTHPTLAGHDFIVTQFKRAFGL